MRSLIGTALLAALAAAPPAGAQSATIPNTPAGQVFKAWLDAINSGDTARMGAYVRQYEPGNSVAIMTARRRNAGDFVLLTIERSDPRHIEYTVRSTAQNRDAFGYLDVTSANPPQVSMFPLTTPLPVGGNIASISVDAATRARTIDGAIAQLDTFYVFPEVVKRIADSLHARLERGAYDRYTNGVTFAKALLDDVRDISKDKHMGVQYSVNPIPVRPAGPPRAPTAEQRQRMQAQMDADNCGFRKAEVLDGNIGYLKFDFFADPDLCAPTAAAAMNFLAGTRALIVDMRENGGGSPAMVSYVASYLFTDSTHLNDLWDRKSGSTTQFWTTPSVPGRKFGAGKPVYVLTAARTFSGAEEYTYDLKTQKRATIIGETTGGGAHPVAARRINEHFVIGVPGARAINPVTHTDWEGVGVEPDVKVPAADALATAIRLLNENPAGARP